MPNYYDAEGKFIPDVNKEGRAIGTEARVCEDIAKRQAHGLAKYRTTVEDNPLSLREWLQHAYEECLDEAVYLRRAIEEIDSLECGNLPEMVKASGLARLVEPDHPDFKKLAAMIVCSRFTARPNNPQTQSSKPDKDKA